VSPSEILAQLPNGMHDASISQMRVEFGRGTVTLDMEFWVGDLDAEDEAQREAYRLGKLVLTGVVAMLLEPPVYRYSRTSATFCSARLSVGAAMPSSAVMRYVRHWESRPTSERSRIGA